MDLSETKIRKIVKEEFEKLRELFPDDDEQWIKYKNKRLKQFDTNTIDVFVIEDNDKFIGELTINYCDDDIKEKTIPNQRAYFEAFRLDERYQGLGLGQQLIKFAINDLESRGYKEFTIGVEEENEVAKHIYFKLGFNNPIAKGHSTEFDSSDYTLYLRK